MWALVAVAVVAGIAVYEYLKQPTSPAELAAAADKTKAAALAAQRQLTGGYTPPPVAADRAQMCGLLATDYQAADVWSRTYLGPALPVPARLKLMLSVHSYATWPAEAKRVYCAYVEQLAPTNFPHAHWGG